MKVVRQLPAGRWLISAHLLLWWWQGQRMLELLIGRLRGGALPLETAEHILLHVHRH